MCNLRQETDDQLVRLYENGNDDAFDILLERYQQNVYGYVLSIVCDTDVANDIFQDTFFKAIQCIRAHRYTAEGKFQQWLMRIARNRVIDTFRRAHPTADIASDRTTAAVAADVRYADVSVEDIMHNEQTYEDLRSMIARLPEPQQQVVRMRVYDKLSFKEIAAATHVSINTALGRMHYALLNLRRMAAHRDLTLRHTQTHILA